MALFRSILLQRAWSSSWQQVLQDLPQDSDMAEFFWHWPIDAQNGQWWLLSSHLAGGAVVVVFVVVVVEAVDVDVQQVPQATPQFETMYPGFLVHSPIDAQWLQLLCLFLHFGGVGWAKFSPVIKNQGNDALSDYGGVDLHFTTYYSHIFSLEEACLRKPIFQLFQDIHSLHHPSWMKEFWYNSLCMALFYRVNRTKKSGQVVTIKHVWKSGFIRNQDRTWRNLEEPGGTWKNPKELTTADLKFHIFFEDIFAPDQAQCT